MSELKECDLGSWVLPTEYDLMPHDAENLVGEPAEVITITTHVVQLKSCAGNFWWPRNACTRLCGEMKEGDLVFLEPCEKDSLLQESLARVTKHLYFDLVDSAGDVWVTTLDGDLTYWPAKSLLRLPNKILSKYDNLLQEAHKQTEEDRMFFLLGEWNKAAAERDSLRAFIDSGKLVFVRQHSLLDGELIIQNTPEGGAQPALLLDPKELK